MTNQLPLLSTEKDLTTKHAVHGLLAKTIKDLHESIFKIELPKTEMAKTVKIPVGTLHLIRNLAASASSLMQESPLNLGDTTKLDNIGRQLVDIRACSVAPAPAMPPLPPPKRTYNMPLPLQWTSTPLVLLPLLHHSSLRSRPLPPSCSAWDFI